MLGPEGTPEAALRGAPGRIPHQAEQVPDKRNACTWLGVDSRQKQPGKPGGPLRPSCGPHRPGQVLGPCPRMQSARMALRRKLSPRPHTCSRW